MTRGSRWTSPVVGLGEGGGVRGNTLLPITVGDYNPKRLKTVFHGFRTFKEGSELDVGSKSDMAHASRRISLWDIKKATHEGTRQYHLQSRASANI